MSTDSTELTFVRCPSCRSLVPAISTRCRMCGATLEASAADTSTVDQEQKKSGRVRQRTMSEANSEISSTAQQLREQPEAVEAAPAEVPDITPIAGEVDSDDPLSAYIEEVEAADDAPTSHKEVDTKPAYQAEQKSALQNGNENGKAVVTPPSQKIVSAPVADEVDLGEDDHDPFDMPEEDPVPQPKAAAPARVIVESGGRKAGESRLSFGGAPREEAAPRSEPVPQNKAPQQNNRPKTPPPEAAPVKAAEPAKVVEPVKAAESEQKPRMDQRPAQQHQQSRPAQSRENDRRDSQQQKPRTEEPRPQQHARAEQPQQKPRQSEAREERSLATAAPKPNAQKQSGRLFGWFVNYSDPAGSAIEIREGKFFLSGKGVKPNDLVIDDKTISTPHALLTVSPATGLIVQDLMSERGVFVRKKDGEVYKKEDEAVTLTHGDWIKFGDVELLISLIAYPGDK